MIMQPQPSVPPKNADAMGKSNRNKNALIISVLNSRSGWRRGAVCGGLSLSSGPVLVLVRGKLFVHVL
jgi:hypothetical protein